MDERFGEAPTADPGASIVYAVDKVAFRLGDGRFVRMNADGSMACTDELTEDEALTCVRSASGLKLLDSSGQAVREHVTFEGVTGDDLPHPGVAVSFRRCDGKFLAAQANGIVTWDFDRPGADFVPSDGEDGKVSFRAADGQAVVLLPNGTLRVRADDPGSAVEATVSRADGGFGLARGNGRFLQAMADGASARVNGSSVGARETLMFVVPQIIPAEMTRVVSSANGQPQVQVEKAPEILSGPLPAAPTAPAVVAPSLSSSENPKPATRRLVIDPPNSASDRRARGRLPLGHPRRFLMNAPRSSYRRGLRSSLPQSTSPTETMSGRFRRRSRAPSRSGFIDEDHSAVADG
jgi:hypothetical protein